MKRSRFSEEQITYALRQAVIGSELVLMPILKNAFRQRVVSRICDDGWSDFRAGTICHGSRPDGEGNSAR